MVLKYHHLLILANKQQLWSKIIGSKDHKIAKWVSMLFTEQKKKTVKKNINKEQEQKGSKNDKAGCFPPEFEFML